MQFPFRAIVGLTKDPEKQGPSYRIIRQLLSHSIRQYINFVVNLCKKAKQEGTLSLEKDISKITNLFLKDAVEMLVDGYKIEEIQEILTERISNKIDNEKAEIDLLNNMSKFAPAFGLVLRETQLTICISRWVIEPSCVSA